MADAGAAARAADFLKKADKRLTSFSLFGGNKYEEAAELLEKAANQYKLAKCCEGCFFVFVLISSIDRFMMVMTGDG